MDSVYAKFTRTLGEYSMLDGRKGVLVGFSGGADSSALLRLLFAECRRRGIYLRAVHVHHGIRGAEADRDAEFCRSTCRALGVDFELVRADIPALARASGRGVEETARDFRYETFSRIIAEDPRLDTAATAHNADDNAETLLFNLIRGSSVGGLGGIPPVRALGDFTVVRPLIACTKREILEYCSGNSIEYVFDSTNDDTAYTRNFIRHELMPMIERLNPAFPEAAERLAKSARFDDEYLDLAAEKLIGGADRIELAELNGAHRAIASRAVVRLYARVSDAALSSRHIEAVLTLCRAGRGELSLPDRVCAVIVRGELVFTREKKAPAGEFYFELGPGINRFDDPDFAFYLPVKEASGGDIEKDIETLKKFYKLSIHIRLKSDTINNILFVRSRRPGDCYVYGKMTRKLKKLFNDRGLGADIRSKIPILCDDEGIVWVPGFPAADRAASVRSADRAASVRSDRDASDSSDGREIVFFYNNEGLT